MRIVSKIKQTTFEGERMIVVPSEFPEVTLKKICSAWKIGHWDLPDGSRVIPYDKEIKLLLKVAMKLGKKFHVLLL